VAQTLRREDPVALLDGDAGDEVDVADVLRRRLPAQVDDVGAPLRRGAGQRRRRPAEAVERRRVGRRRHPASDAGQRADLAAAHRPRLDHERVPVLLAAQPHCPNNNNNNNNNTNNTNVVTSSKWAIDLNR